MKEKDRGRVNRPDKTSNNQPPDKGPGNFSEGEVHYQPVRDTFPPPPPPKEKE